MNASDIIQGKSFGSAVKAAGGKTGMYKRGVQVRYVSGADPVRFRLLPAFNPEDDNPETSVLPFISFDGEVNQWLTQISAVKFIGGNSQGREWTSFVSRESIGEECVYRKLVNVADDDPDWKYLVKRTKTQKPVLPFPRTLVLMNILDIDQLDRGAQVGEFGQSSALTLFGQDGGKMWIKNTRFDEERNELNYLDEYNYGDLTDPQKGFTLVCYKDPKKSSSNFVPADITLDSDETGRCYRWPISEDVLAARVDLSNIESFLNIPTEDEVVEILKRVLNQRNPNGVPETALLRMVLGDTYNIPDPAPAPGAVNSVQGFSPEPPAARPPARQPVQAPPRQTPPRQAPAMPPSPAAKAAAKPAAKTAAKTAPAKPATPAGPDAVDGNAPVKGIPGEPVDDDLFAQLKARR